MSQQSIKKELLNAELKKLCALALKEDKAGSDVTSDLTIPENSVISFTITAREKIILYGVEAIHHCFDELTKLKKFKNIFLALQIKALDGDLVKQGAVIAQGHGDAKLILAAERVILNVMQHLSGISTSTHHFVKALDSRKIKILDTRKTLPTMRNLQKQAVIFGGGINHRFNLSDMILIKDNHIAAAGSITEAVLAAKLNKKKLKIEIECDTFEQVEEALKSGPEIIMLDNMEVAEIKKCTALIRSNKEKQILIEVSGGVTLENIRNFRGLDIDFISIGALTHSVKAVDIGLDIV